MLKKSLIALAVSGLLFTSAHAEVKVNGFASIKAGIALDSDDTLYGYNDSLDFKNESLFAVQLMSDLGEKLSVTAQLVGRGAEDFDVGFEWAFLSYQATEELRINAGRLRTPFYKYSDYRDVGYAYDWLRVPQGVYGLGFDNIEGISFYHTTQLGNFDSSLQIVAGAYNGDAQISGVAVNAKIDNIVGATWEMSQDWYSLRAAYLIGKVSVEAEVVQLQPDVTFGDFFTSLSGLGLTGLVDEIDIKEEDGSFFGIGFTADKNNWLLVAEYTLVKVDNSFIADQKNFYVSVGHRFDVITPYVSYEKEDNEAKTDIYAPYATTLPTQLLIPVTGIVQSQAREATTYNLGLRYDFHPSAAFKVQYSSEDNEIADVRQDVIAFGVDLVF
ncbi:porin [Rheinheimera baltica]|uniref:porin n=1 Tax=Rheinheimera baltica TaxID=67576 RepID=UPI00273DA098|nr:porin [Rheinheimera baltica]MDP5142957.1 porin [Rheinheimera baltica]MDP5190428.1 porin [Rheinheimera baltica]